MNAAFPEKGYGSALPPSSPHRPPRRNAGSRAGRVRRRPKGAGGHPGVRGFTLVEVIAVMAIIAILAAAVAGGLVYANRKAAKTATDALFKKLQFGIEAFHTDYGKYPPHRIPSGGWNTIDNDNPNGWYPMPNTTSFGSFANLNTGTEILWYFLSGIYEDLENIGGPERLNVLQDMAYKTAYVEFGQKDLKRTGIVFLMNTDFTEKTDSATPGDLFPEIVDPWGLPIQYNASGYTGLPNPLANTDTYDLISRGPDRFVADPYNNPDVVLGTKEVNRDNIGNFKLQ